ncbi:MAG: enoyl-CoA hydratase-related protein [Pseudomonadota bacterium]
MTNPVLYEVAAGVATLTLNRPERLNAMTPELMGGITAAFDRVRADESVRAVVLTGAGRGFCAGADLTAVAEGSGTERANDAAASSAQGDQTMDVYNNALRAIHDAPVPTIARINGAAAGGGLGLALACDITIAARSAFFVATFGPRLGIVPDMGATWSVPRLVGRARALGMELLGERIDATRAEQWGLIWRTVDDERLDTEVDAIAAQLARMSPAAALRIRRTADAALNNSFSDQLDLEMVHQGVLIPRNMREGALAFTEKREPAFDGRRDDPSEISD